MKIIYFDNDIDNLLYEAREEGCKWTQFPSWIYWREYDRIMVREGKYNELPISLGSRAADKDARESAKKILAEVGDYIANALLRVDHFYTQEWQEAPWHEPWKWNHGEVTQVAEIVKQYKSIELEEGNEKQ